MNAYPQQTHYPRLGGLRERGAKLRAEHVAFDPPHARRDLIAGKGYPENIPDADSKRPMQSSASSGNIENMHTHHPIRSACRREKECFIALFDARRRMVAARRIAAH